MKKILLPALALMFSTNTFASSLASGWVKITEIRSIMNAPVTFKIVADNPDDLMCTGVEIYSLNVATDTTGVTYTTLLAAAAANQKVKIESWGQCTGWGTEIGAINVKYN